MANKFLGLSLGKQFSVVSENYVLDKQQGTLKPITLDLINTNDSVSIKKDVEVVTAVEIKKIDLSLVTSNGNIDPVSGFLIEVYLSGSDGKLTRVYKNDVVDVLNDDILVEGFGNYLNLELDK